MLRLVAGLVAVGLVVFGAMPAGARPASKSDDAKFLDSLAIPVPGMMAIQELAGTTVPMAVADGYEIYRFSDGKVHIDKTAPNWERVHGTYKAGKTSESVCIDFAGPTPDTCMDVIVTNGEVRIKRNGQTLIGEAYYDAPTKLGKEHKMPKELAFNINLQTQCMCFKEIEREAAKGNFRDIMEKTEPDGSEWYENGEPFFDAELTISPWYKPCVVNEGQNLLFCEVAKIWGTTAAKEADYEKLLVGIVSKCFNRKPNGPAPDRHDPLRTGTEWWLNDNLAVYAMKGAFAKGSKVGADSRLFLVTFNIGKRKK